MSEYDDLIAEARTELTKIRFGSRQSGKVALGSHLDLIRRLTDALEAHDAQVRAETLQDAAWRITRGAGLIAPPKREHPAVTWLRAEADKQSPNHADRSQG